MDDFKIDYKFEGSVIFTNFLIKEAIYIDI